MYACPVSILLIVVAVFCGAAVLYPHLITPVEVISVGLLPPICL